MEGAPVEGIDVQGLYAWIDSIPLSRPKRSIARDFSDGVAAAEVVRHYLPKLVDLHNYSSANSVGQKLYNWNTLNQKVFKKLGYTLSEEMIQSIVNSKPGYAEILLHDLRDRVEQYISTRGHPIPFVRGSSDHQDRSSPTIAIQPSNEYPSQRSDQFTAQSVYQDPHQVSSDIPARQQPLPALPKNPDPRISPELGVPRPQKYPQAHNQQQRQSFYESQQLQQLDVGGMWVSNDFLNEIKKKDIMISELQETVQMLQLKVAKLEQLITLQERRLAAQRFLPA
ncbi:hypothetical protein BJ742DRAFT_706288 [Cladochytrium replicatum]|nr:hypothetical protein BJ742DRAFT_706288 [Cladochytrium replicatum]